MSHTCDRCGDERSGCCVLLKEQTSKLIEKWRKRLAPHREEGDPPEEFIIDLMEDFIKDLESL